MKYFFQLLKLFLLTFFFAGCVQETNDSEFFVMGKDDLKDKIMGAWALQTIGVTYGGPTEFRYLKRVIPDSIAIPWSDSAMYKAMKFSPGLYDDIYMDLTFVDVLEKEGLDASPNAFATAYANAGYWLWHANQQGRYNVQHGIAPPASGNWINNPHADDIDFQIEADFAGIMSPGMPGMVNDICDPVGHIMNSGDGYYGGVYMAALYSNAFVLSDIEQVVSESLQIIPKESTYYQCMADVITWYAEYPNDWQKTWTLVEEKWGEDIGCPDGALSDFNIDAKINSAYVIMGLLYGRGDIDMTMEIATRCGQDSDCNPASAAGILGAMIGYKNIPEKWASGLSMVEDLDFKYTEISLNDVYGMSYRHALKVIEKYGGEVNDNEVKIIKREPVPIALEQNFPAYRLVEKRQINKEISNLDEQNLSFDFSGIGIVVRGKVNNRNFSDIYALESDEQTLNGYIVKMEFTVDDMDPVVVEEPLAFIRRNHELFFKYELVPGDHQLSMKVLNPHPDVIIQLYDAIVYDKDI